jgi:hypothetical protein
VGVETGGCPHTAIREDADEPRGSRSAQREVRQSGSDLR